MHEASIAALCAILSQPRLQHFSAWLNWILRLIPSMISTHLPQEILNKQIEVPLVNIMGRQ